MTNMPSRRELLGSTGLGALAAEMSNAKMAPRATIAGDVRPPDGADQPLPDPTNDKALYDSAKQYIHQRFATQLLVRQIDYGLNLDSLKTKAPVQLEFLSRNVEQLAQQCASLLERGIGTRSEYELAAEKDLETLSELAEFLLRDAEFQNEARLGYYSLDYLSASADQAASSAYVSSANAAPAGAVRDSLKPEADSENAKASFQQQRTDFERITIATRRERAQAARLSYALKVLSYAQLNGPNNYPSRLDVLQNRFLLDFASAAARLPVLYKGLKEIYGYDRPLPLSASQTLFDDALIWLRNAAEFLVSFAASDQGYTLPVSVRSLVGASAWERAISSGVGQISFNITEKMFPQQRHVRLRGASMYAVCSNPSLLSHNYLAYLVTAWPFHERSERRSIYARNQ